MLKSQPIEYYGTMFEVHITSIKGGNMLLRIIDADPDGNHDILITFNTFVSFEEFKNLGYMYFNSQENELFIDFLIDCGFIYPTGRVKGILGIYFNEYKVNKNKFFGGNNHD